MKKITLVLLVLALISVLCLGLASCAANTETYENFVCRFDAKTDGYIIVGYKGAEAELEIPASLNGKPVTEIGGGAFLGNVKLTKVTFPKTVKLIGASAFSGCTALTELKLADGLEKIDYRAFSGCKALAAVDIPTSVKEIYHYAFADCTALTVFGVKSDLSVYANAFSGCTLLKTISTPATPKDAVYKFSNGVMFSADGKTLVSYILNGSTYEIPAGVTSISGGAFFGNKTLSEFTVAAGNTSFKAIDGVLYSADGTTLIAYPANKSDDVYTLPGTVTKIADCAFSGNSILEKIILNDTVTAIGKSAFEDCVELVELNVGNATATVGEYAFANCKKLASYVISDSAPAYKFVSGVLFTADETGIISYPAGKTETSYIVPATVKTVAPGAFALGSALKEFKLAEGNTNFKANGGVLYSADGTKLIACPAAAEGEFTVPENVTVVAEGAFRGCAKLKKAVLPATVIAIEADTFRDCSSLAELVIKGAVNKIGNYAFSGCSALTSISYYSTEAQWNSAKAAGTGNEVLDGIKPNYVK